MAKKKQQYDFSAFDNVSKDGYDFSAFDNSLKKKETSGEGSQLDSTTGTQLESPTEDKSGFRTVAEKGGKPDMEFENQAPDVIDMQQSDRILIERQAAEKQQRKQEEEIYKQIVTGEKAKVSSMLGEKSNTLNNLQDEINFNQTNLKELSKYNELNLGEFGIQEELTELSLKNNALQKQQEQESKNATYLKDAKYLINKTDKFLKSDRAGISGWLDAVKNTALTKDFATLGISRIIRNFNILEIAKKQRSGAELTPEENQGLVAYGLLNEIRSNVDTGLGTVTGEAMVEMIPYLVSFAASGGTGKAVEGTMSGLLKVASKKGVGAIASKTASFLVGSAARIPFFESLYSGVAERQIGDIAVTPDMKAKTIEGTEESFKKALVKSIAATGSEVVTEQFGERLFPKVTKMFGKGELTQSIEKSVLDRVKSTIGFDGFVSEMGEEFANKIFTVGLEGDPAKEVFNMKEFMATALTVGVMSGTFQGVNLLTSKKVRSEVMESKGIAEGELDTDAQKKVDNILNSESNTDEKASNLVDFINKVKEENATSEDIKNIIQYSQYKVAEDAMLETEEVIKEDKEKKKEEIKNAITERKTKPVSKLEVRAQVGEEAPLRQPSEKPAGKEKKVETQLTEKTLEDVRKTEIKPEEASAEEVRDLHERAGEAVPEGRGGLLQKGKRGKELITTEQIEKTRKEKLTEKEVEIKNRLNERLSRLSGSKFVVGEEKNPDVAKEIVGVIKDLSELGLIKIEKGVDYIIEEVKKYLPGVKPEDIDKYRDDIAGIYSKKPEERISGIKKALVPEDVINETELERRSATQMLERGIDLVENEKINPSAIINEINKKPRALQPDEVSSLVYYKAKLDNKFDEAYDRLEESISKGDKAEENQRRLFLNSINSEIDSYHEMALNTAYEQSLAFRLRKMLLDSEYNLKTQIRKYKSINKGEIPADVETRFKEYDRQINELNSKLRKIGQGKSDKVSKDIINKIKESKKPDRLRGKDLIAEGFGELSSALGITKMAIGDKKPDVAKALVKIGRGMIDEGLATIENVIDKISAYLDDKVKGKVNIKDYEKQVKEGLLEISNAPTVKGGKVSVTHDLIRDYVKNGLDDINDIVGEIKKDFNLEASEREIRDAITRYGKEAMLNKEEIEVKIRELKRMGRTISALEDVREQKKKPLKSGLQRDKLTEREKNLNQQLKEAIKELPVSQAEMEKAEELRLDVVKKNFKKSIADYETRLKEKDFEPRRRRAQPHFDTEAHDLEMEKIKIKNKYDLEQERVRLKNRPLSQQAKDLTIDIYNLPKALLASADFSAPLRQGAILTIANPMAGMRATKEMFRQTFSQKKTDKWIEDIKASDKFVLIKQSDLYVAEPSAKLSAKEEMFMSNIAHRIPVLKYIFKASERAYTGYLNKLRVDVFLSGADAMMADGYTFKENPEVFKAWADFINNATGRGKLGPLERSATVLNTAFFSPRLVASRFNLLNPAKYAKMPAPVRKMALRNMASFIGFGMTVLTLAQLAGAEVEEDPRSADFGKIKIGNLRIDIWAGFQQPVRMMAQVISGQRKSTSTGVVKKLSAEKFPYQTRGDVVSGFARSKLAPTSGLLVNILTGQTMMGEELTFKKELFEHTIPLYIQDINEIYRDEGIDLTGTAAVLALFGVGVQYYGGKTNVVMKSLKDGLSLEETKNRAKIELGDKYTTTKAGQIEKEYGIYKKYGYDDEMINFLMTKGLTNEEKAQYLFDKKVNKAKMDEYWKNRVVSDDLYSKWKSKK